MSGSRRAKVKHKPALLLLTPRGGSHNHCYVMSDRSLELSVLSSVFGELKREVEGAHPTLDGRKMVTGRYGRFFYAARRAQQRGGRFSHEIATWLSHHADDQAQVSSLLLEALERFDDLHSTFDWEYDVEGGILVSAALSEVEAALLSQERRPDAQVTFEIDLAALTSNSGVSVRVMSAAITLALLGAGGWWWATGPATLEIDAPTAPVTASVKAVDVVGREEATALKSQKDAMIRRRLNELKERRAAEVQRKAEVRATEASRCDPTALERARGLLLSPAELMKERQIGHQELLSFLDQPVALLELYQSRPNRKLDHDARVALAVNIMNLYKTLSIKDKGQLEQAYAQRFKHLSRGCFEGIDGQLLRLEEGITKWIKEGVDQEAFMLKNIDHILETPIKGCLALSHLSLCEGMRAAAQGYCKRPEMAEINKELKEELNVCTLSRKEAHIE